MCSAHQKDVPANTFCGMVILSSHRGFAGMPSPHCTCPLGSVSKGKVMKEQCPAAFLLSFLQYVASNGFLITSEHPLCLTGKSLGKPVAMRGFKFRKRSSNFCVVKGRGFSSDLHSRVWGRTCTAGIGGRSASKRWEEPSQKTCRGVYLRFKGGFGSARA